MLLALILCASYIAEIAEMQSLPPGNHVVVYPNIGVCSRAIPALRPLQHETARGYRSGLERHRSLLEIYYIMQMFKWLSMN